MSKSVDVPTEYTIHSTVSGSVDMGLDDIKIKEIAPITLNTTSQLNSSSSLNSTSKLDSTSKVDMGLDDIRIKELPRIEVGLEMSMKPTRVHFPVNYKFGLNTLGMELLSFVVCGESMVIIEDYVPHRREACV
ncbi:MAG: hypothetical protein ACREL3_10915 [Gemmatimonadales bacterium]